MKTQVAQEVKALLAGVRHDIIAAARAANGGPPAQKDIAELMDAWGRIVKAVTHPRSATNKTFVTAQLDMLAGLMGEAA